MKRPIFGQEMLNTIGATSILDLIESSFRTKHVLAATIHGDLHSANVICHAERKYLVDWDRYERLSPVLIDYIEAFLSVYDSTSVRWNVASRLKRLHEILLTKDSEVSKRITRSFGDLSLEEAVTVYQLHRASWVLCRHGLAHGKELRNVKLQLHLCEILFQNIA